MKDLTDYFRRSDKNYSIKKDSPIVESKVVLIDCQVEERARKRKSEKRKLESTSECDGYCRNEKNSYKERSKSSSEVERHIFNGKNYSNNFTIRLEKVDDQLVKNELNERKTDSKIKYLKNVVVEDCFNFIDKTTLKEKNNGFGDHGESKMQNTGSPKSRRAKKKRRSAGETYDTDSDELNSSDSLFKVDENSKKTYRRKSGRPEKFNLGADANNLFNYFSKTNNVSKADESPVKRSKTIQVVALVHSPPKARIKAKKLNNEIKENRSPVVKIVRFDAVKVNSYDEIKVVSTDIIDVAEIREKHNASETKSDGNSSSSDTFSVAPRKIQPWKMRVQFTTTGKGLILKKPVSKSKPKEDVNEKPKINGKETLKKNPQAMSKENINKMSKKDVKKSKVDIKETSRENGTEMPKKNVKETPHIYKNKKKAKKVVNRPLNSNDDVLVVLSDSSQDKTSPKTKRKSSLDSDDDLAPEVMESRSKSLPNRVKEPQQTEPKKLAPLFCKKYDQKMKPKPLPKINHEAIRLFLESGVPDEIKIKHKQEEQNSAPEEYLGQYTFPKSNHVQQKNPSDYAWSLTNVLQDLKLKPLDDDIVKPESSVINGLINNDTTPTVNVCGQVQFDVQDEVAALKKLEPDVNVGDIFTSVKRLHKEAASENNAICWTDKYKPNCYKDLIGNSTSLVKLKEWIESHKRRKITLDENNSSSEEFIDSDDSSSSTIAKNNVAMVVGPPGCGKTCAVYMLANELGFKVLEVNTASNRNGKRILDELQEATQSHRVKRTTIFDKEIKKSNKKKKIKHEKKTMSLILIEDADILFENYDEGFLSALNSLTSQSKRPFIFTMNDINYPHLAKYNNAQNLVLKFTYPTGSLLKVWLQLIALTEGRKLTDEVLMYLYHVAGLDLRKNLLQLQMLISSNKNFSKLSGEQVFYNDWCRRIICNNTARSPVKKQMKRAKRRHTIFSDDEDDSAKDSNDISCTLIPIVPKTKSEKDNDLKALRECSSFFETVAFLGSLETNTAGLQMNFLNKEIRTCRSTANVFHAQLNTDIADRMKAHIFSKFRESDSAFSFKDYYNKIKQNSEIKEVSENVFNYYSPRPMDSSSKNCDYLPTIRDIARTERNKFSGNVKRSSRYFSYLKSVNIHVTEKATDFLCNSLI